MKIKNRLQHITNWKQDMSEKYYKTMNKTKLQIFVILTNSVIKSNKKNILDHLSTIKGITNFQKWIDFFSLDFKWANRNIA